VRTPCFSQQSAAQTKLECRETQTLTRVLAQLQLQQLPQYNRAACCDRLIGDSQTERWYDSIECFLAEYLVQEPRAPPLQDTSSNLWLMNLDERLPHKGSFWSPPKPAICAHYQVPSSMPHNEDVALCSCMRAQLHADPPSRQAACIDDDMQHEA
jgi:hypothetical protein